MEISRTLTSRKLKGFYPGRHRRVKKYSPGPGLTSDELPSLKRDGKEGTDEVKIPSGQSEECDKNSGTLCGRTQFIAGLLEI